VKVCKKCSGSGKLAGDTQVLSEIPGVCVAYRVLSWLKCHVCGGNGRIAPEPKGEAK